MQLITVFSALALAAVAHGQDSDMDTITIEVGEGGLVMKPDSVMAKKGQKIEFEFYPMNHSVVQGDVSKPCQPAANAWWSGYVPSSKGESSTKFVLTINDTEPIYYYCSQEEHCQGGMVGVINPPNDSALTDYRKASNGADENVAPKTGPMGGIFSTGDDDDDSSSSAASTMTMSASGASASASSASMSASAAATSASASESSSASEASATSAAASGMSATPASTGTETGSATGAATPATTSAGASKLSCAAAVVFAAAGFAALL
ncbi:MAG: hypothetical protein M4579_004880 [Chaenotheca gracillima]|nr:MAG: hypothetical protein M4579_004880 [Chaenotheca gracillima]